MTMREDDPAELPTEEELREAEALARALDRGNARGVPDDALQAAALLRYSRDGGELPSARADAILEDALSRARKPAVASRKGWLLGVLGLAAAGAATWLTAVGLEPAPSPPRAELPPPPASLLAAQVEVATNRSASLATLDARTDEYRSAVYATLKGRYRP
jgi:hypothetical protein